LCGDRGYGVDSVGRCTSSSIRAASCICALVAHGVNTALASPFLRTRMNAIVNSMIAAKTVITIATVT
jgi:hypothetical protein